MRKLSNRWKEKVKNGMDVQYLKYADITLTDGTVLNLTSADLWANGFSFEDSVSNDSSFDIGSTIINVLTLSINNFDGQYSDYDFDGAEVICYVGMEFDDGTTEKIRICTATVVEQPEDETVTIDLTCEDNMRKFDRNYSDSKLKYPATRGQIVRDACEVCGVTLQTTSFDRDDYIVQNRPNDEALTFRQVLQWVAQICCQWMRCDEYGRLCINWYGGSVDEEELVVDVLGTLKTQNGSNIKLNFSSSDGVLSADNGVLLESNGVLRLFATDGKGNVSSIKTTYGFTPHHTDVVITGVKVTEYSDSASDELQTYMDGTEGYVLAISDNKLIRKGDGQTVASMIAEKCVGMRFRPFESECPTDVSLEAGDSLLIVDRTGKIYNSFLTSTTLQPGAGQRIACNAKSAAKNSSTRYSQATQAFVAARNMVKQEKTEREKALEEFGKRIDSATGVYTTVEPQENGSKIFYLHDKPTLAESQAIWKMTSEAWGVSTDGGQTWNGGMTVDGDTIVRILNAVGVNATWINTGAITVKDANENILFQVDMDTKKVIISGDNVVIGDSSLSDKLTKMDNNIASAKNMTFQLSNDMQTITSDADGNIPVFPTVTTTAKVMYGSSDITNDCSYTITKSDSVTGSWDVDTHTYTVTGLSADDGWVDIKATYLINLSITKRFTISKQKSGKSGEDGLPGRTYYLRANTEILLMGQDKKITPNPFNVHAYYRDGQGDEATFKTWWVVEYSKDAGKTWTKMAFNSQTSGITINPDSYSLGADGMIRATIYTDSGRTKIADQQTWQVAVDVGMLTQEQIVEILSNGGEFKGLYYLNGHLYISLDALMGNAAILGGAKNGNGYLKIKDKKGTVKGLIDYSGYTAFTSYEENSTRMKYTGICFSDTGINPVSAEKYFSSTADIEYVETAWGIDWTAEELNISATEVSADTGTFGDLTVTNSASFAKSPKIENMEYTTSSNTICWDGRTGYKQLMLKSSSSKRYKDIGNNIAEQEIEEWYNIEPLWAKYKDGYLVKGDENEGRYIPMFIAEDVEEYFPEATRHANGLVEDWNERIMIPAMFAMLKAQKKKIDQQEKLINKLCEKLNIE